MACRRSSFLALALIGALGGAAWIWWYVLGTAEVGDGVTNPPPEVDSAAVTGNPLVPGLEEEGRRRVVESNRTGPPLEPPRALVTVHVVDGRDDEPVPGIECELVLRKEPETGFPRGVTGKDGSVELHAAEGVRLYVVRAWAEHLAVDHVVEEKLRADVPRVIRIALPALGTLRGRVVDLDGEGVSDCEVHGFAKHFAHGLRRHYPPPRLVARSGPDGFFEVHGVTGHFKLEPRLTGHRGLCRIEGDIAPGESLDHLLLVVAPVRDLHGTITGVGGDPVEGVRVYAGILHPGRGVSLGFSKPFWYEGEGISDASGVYVLPALPRVPMEVEYRHDLHIFHVEEVLADAEVWDVRLGPAHEQIHVTGVVRGPHGEPVAGARIHADLPNTAPQLTTNAVGEFECSAKLVRDPAFESGRETHLFVLAEGYAPRMLRPLTLSSGDNHFEIVLEAEHELAGVVLDAEERPVPNASLWLSSELEVWPGMDSVSWADNKYHRADEEGRFRIGALGDGDFLLLVRAGVGAPFRGHRVRSGQTELVLRLDVSETELVRFRVHVVDDETGTPIEGYVAIVRGPRSGGSSSADAPNGWWEARPLLPGRYRLTVRADGYAQAHVPLREYPVGPHEFEFRLRHSAPLRLRVVDANQRPLAGMTVLPYDLHGRLLSYDDEEPRPDDPYTLPKTGWDGRCWFASLPRGAVRLELTTPDGGATRTIEVDLVTQGDAELVVRF